MIGVVALGLLLGASGAEAGLFGSKRKLPRPIDSPVVRPQVQEGHKPGKRQRHPTATFVRPIDSPVVRPRVQEGHKPGKRQRHPTVSSVELSLPAQA